VVGAAVSSLNLVHVSDTHVLKLITGHHLQGLNLATLKNAAEGSYPVALINQPLQSIATLSFKTALDFIMWVYFGLCCLGFVLSLVLPKSKH
jgi:hypothetical protein